MRLWRNNYKNDQLTRREACALLWVTTTSEESVAVNLHFVAQDWRARVWRQQLKHIIVTSAAD